MFFFFSRRNFFISCSSVTLGSITPPLQPGLQFSSAFFFLCCLFRDLVLFIMVSINSLLQGSLNSFNNFRYERKKRKEIQIKQWYNVKVMLRTFLVSGHFHKEFHPQSYVLHRTTKTTTGN